MRTGFTLVELLLVLTLLVVGAAIASVSLSGGQERALLQRSAEQVGDAWSRARLAAIESGSPLVFRCRIGDGWGYVGTSEIPDEIGAEGSVSGEAGSSDADALETDQLEVTLEGGGVAVVFQQLLVADRPGASPVGATVREGELSSMVVFYPDGATSDAEATLKTEGGRTLLVTLRGLTGAVRITDPPVEVRVSPTEAM